MSTTLCVRKFLERLSVRIGKVFCNKELKFNLPAALPEYRGCQDQWHGSRRLCELP